MLLVSNPFRSMWATRPALIAAALLAVCLLGLMVPEAHADQLKLAIILTRHGVRSPLQSSEDLAAFSSQPWPKWETPPGIQTPHGNQLIALMGDYYRARFQRSGLLSGDPAVDGPLVYIRADNDQRTMETARILGKALVAVGDPDVHAHPKGDGDSLFRAYRAHVGHPNLDLAAASVLGRIGGDPANVERAFATQLGELDAIRYGPGGKPADADQPTKVVSGNEKYVVTLKGRLQTALQCTDAFILEFADGMPMEDVAWGRMDEKTLTDMVALNSLYFDLGDRTFYPAQVEGSNLASHIVDTLEQGAGTDSVPGAIGPQGEHVVILAGHDSDISYIGGLFAMNWWVPGTAMNPTLPGGALLFELWQGGEGKAGYYVRVSYVAQTLKQQREATVLTLDAPPALSPICIPGAGGVAPNFETPLASFVRQARKVIDPAFIAPED
jgi:4-phytase / acid phosphatase